jgi:hypothetical protein
LDAMVRFWFNEMLLSSGRVGSGVAGLEKSTVVRVCG